MTSTTNAESPRARMVRSAARMMCTRGVHGVGMRQIASDANGPRGSLQRYFPGGKTQVMLEAVDVALEEFVVGIQAATTAASLPEAIAMVVMPWREVLRTTGFASGCPIAAVVVDVAEDPTMRAEAEQRFHRWRQSIAAVYKRFGYDRDTAWNEAILVISALEGAALAARAGRTLEPIDTIERLLIERAASSH